MTNEEAAKMANKLFLDRLISISPIWKAVSEWKGEIVNPHVVPYCEDKSSRDSND